MAFLRPRFLDTLPGRLTLVAVASLVPVALAAGVAIFALVDGQREAGAQKSLEVTRLAASGIEVELQRNLASLRTLTVSPKARDSSMRTACSVFMAAPRLSLSALVSSTCAGSSRCTA